MIVSAKRPAAAPPPPQDRVGAAVQGLCGRGDRCWGPYIKIGNDFPMKRCKVCKRTS